MIVLPVIARELRAEARGAFTYWLRVIGAGALMVTGGWLVLDHGLGAQGGGVTFSALHLTLFGAIWVIVPLMTADCISRERREGTLGLLFLTPLRAFEVVLAKSLAHGLRAFALCLAGAPVLVIPFLQGGVGWPEAVFALCVNAGALVLALGAGVLASAGNRSLSRSMITAGALAFLLALGLCLALGASLAWEVGGWPGQLSEDWWTWETIFQIGAAALTQPGRVMDYAAQSGPPNAVPSFLGVVSIVSSLACLGLCALLRLAAWVVKRQAHETPRSAARVRLEKTFCTPAVGVGLYRRWMRRLLDRNPMGWLERRTWQSRLVLWSWVAVLVALYSSLLPGAVRQRANMEELHSTLGWLLAGNIALSAACSFRREREAGVLELLLISPLSVGQLISGRLRGLWGQFLPPGLLLLGCWAWLLQAFLHLSVPPVSLPEQYFLMGFFAITWLTVPVAGLYFSLRCRNLVIAWIAALVVGVGLPAGVGGMVSALAQDSAGLLQAGWRAAVGTTAALGALVLVLRPLPGLKTFSRGAALLLLALGLVTTLLSRHEDPMLLGRLGGAVVQLLVAARLAFGQHQLLSRRQFSLPS